MLHVFFCIYLFAGCCPFPPITAPPPPPQGLSELPGLGAKARRSLLQLLPYSWTRLNWAVFSSPKRLLQVPRVPHLSCVLHVLYTPSGTAPSGL